MTTGRFDIDRLDQLAAEGEVRVQRYREVATELEGMVVTASNDDRSVSVDVAYGEGIRDLRITQQAMDRGVERLGAQIVTQLGRAQAELARRVADRLAGDVVTGIDMSQWLVPEEPDERPPQRPPRRDGSRRFDPPE